MSGAVSPVTAGDVLQLVRDGEAHSRADVARMTGLSRTAVAARVDALVGARLVSETEAPGVGVGRPPKRLEFEAGAGLVLAAAIGRSRAQFTVCDLAGRVLGADEHEQEVGLGPDDVMPLAVERLRQLLVGTGRDAADVLGIGVSIPGTVDPVAGTSLNSAIMRGWNGVPIAPYFAALSSAPVVIENDTNVIALAELDDHLTRYRDA